MDLVILRKIAYSVPDFYYQRIANAPKKYRFYGLIEYEDEQCGINLVYGVFRSMYGTNPFIYWVIDDRIILCAKTGNILEQITYDIDGNFESKSMIAYLPNHVDYILDEFALNTAKILQIVPMKYLQKSEDMVSRSKKAKNIKKPQCLSDVTIITQN